MIGVAILIVFAVMLARSIRKPGVAVALLLLFFPGKQLVQASLPFFADHGPVLNIMVYGGLGLLWIYRALRGRAQMMLGIPREYGFHLIFFGLALFSLLWSMDPDIWEHVSKRGADILVFALVVPSLVASTRGINESYLWLTWVGGALSLVCLFGYSESTDNVRLMLEATTEEGGTFGLSPLALGEMGAFTAVVATLGNHPRSLLIMVLRLVAGTAGFLVVARSSRGDLFAAMVSLGLFAMIPHSSAKGFTGRRLASAIAIFATSVAALYYGLFLTDYWERYVDIANDQGTLLRQEMIGGVLSYYLEHPSTWLFGSGWGSSYAIVGFYPHNGPVQALVELGLIGASLWWASVIFVFTHGIRLARQARPSVNELDVLRPTLALMLCALLSNMKAGDCVDVYLALVLATASQTIRRFRSESEKSLFR
jgi:hypothetical protein